MVANEGQRGGRTNTWLPVAKLQRDLYPAVKSDPMLKDYLVWSLSENGAQTDNAGLQFLTIPAGAGTLMPDGTQYADYANCHNYMTHPSWAGLHDNQTWIAADPGPACRVDGLYGNYGRTWRRRFPGYSESNLLTLPRVTTETGVTIGGSFTEQVQALLYLSVYLDQFKRGWKHTAIYLLRDRTDEAGNQTFGFYKPDYTPRLAASYLHDLTTILADTPSAKPPGSLDYSIPNPPTTVHDLLLQKRDGQFELVIWNERFTGGSDEVTVKLAKPATSVAIFDPTAGTSPARHLTDVAAITLSLSNHPVIIEMSSQAPQRADMTRLIHLAGTTHDEMERLRLLRELEARPDLDATLRADLTKLLPVVDDWADGKSHVVVDHSRAAENGYLCRFFTGRVRAAGDGPLYPPDMSPGSPLRPIWAFHRGRMLIWQVIQSSPLLSVKERREKYFGEARQLLQEARAAFPENRVVRMYLGEPIPWPKSCPADPAAPAWANLQREGLEKLADVIHWWIAARQLPDGQFGGGWGDDVEMWRWWVPVMIAFDDPVVTAAQERISSGIFQQPHLREGFTSRVTDVEHSNEDTTDTILPMMHLRPDDPVWKQRALRLAELMRERWTARNERGFLQFKSIYFSVDKVDTIAARAFDTVYHPSIIQPTLLYWQRTGDQALTTLFGEWLKVWVDAAARAENGKPAGVLPSAIRWPDGGVAKTDRPWWEPFSIGHNDALYNWPGATRLMTSTLLLAYHMTQEEKYLEPIRSMAALREKHLKSAEGEPGSEAWCARRMSAFLSDALAKYRRFTGDTRYDTLLRADASGYVRYQLTGDTAPLETALRRNAEAFRSNWEAYTAEMRWTDRVMSFTRNFLIHLPEPAPPAPSPEILYSSATGDPGNPLVFPLNAVRWRTAPREIAALVTDSSRTSFAAELYHFGTQPRDFEAELFLLSPGDYRLILTATDTVKATPLQQRVFHVEGPRVRVSLELPARRLCLVKVSRQ